MFNPGLLNFVSDGGDVTLMLSRVIQNNSYGTQTFSIDNVLAGNYGHVPASAHQLAFNTTVALGNWTSHGSNTEQSLYVHDKRLKFCGPNHTGYMAASFACKPHEQNTIDLDIERREAVGNMVLLVMDATNNVQLANYTLPQGNNSLQHISLNFNPGSQSSIELRLYNIGCYTLVDDIEVWYNRVVIHTVCDHSRDYRFGFNGKENDNEIIGTGRWQDYGERMYRTELGRFFSPDPIIVYGKKYPELSTYQFASNTPIQAIDLDGLEAFYVQYGIRGSVPILPNGIGITASYSVGMAFDLHGNLGVYQQGSLGVQQGVGIAFGGSGGVNWQANSINNLSGFAGNVGGFLGPLPVTPFELSGELTLNLQAQGLSELVSGFNFGIPQIPGLTAGASFYGEAAALNFIGTVNIGDSYSNFSYNFNNLMNQFESSFSNLLNPYGLGFEDVGYDAECFGSQVYDLMFEAGVVPSINLEEVVIN